MREEEEIRVKISEINDRVHQLEDKLLTETDQQKRSHITNTLSKCKGFIEAFKWVLGEI